MPCPYLEARLRNTCRRSRTANVPSSVTSGIITSPTSTPVTTLTTTITTVSRATASTNAGLSAVMKKTDFVYREGEYRGQVKTTNGFDGKLIRGTSVDITLETDSVRKATLKQIVAIFRLSENSK